jgi:alanyl-tRNA synthetase
MLEKLKDAQRQIEKAKSAALLDKLSDLIGAPEEINGVKIYRFVAPVGTQANQIRDLVMSAKSQVRSTNNVIAGAVVEEGKVSVVLSVDSAAKENGLSANNLLNELMTHLDGRGGGSADLAQGGGVNVDGINDAFQGLLEIVRAATK